MAARFCPMCDLGSMDDAIHFVMQCRSIQDKRSAMFEEIDRIFGEFGNNIKLPGTNVFMILFGKPCANIPDDLMENIWITAANHIANMY